MLTTLIYIDTNVYLDFYQAAHDSIAVFDELHEVRENLVITEQTGQEFARNRNSRLAQLAGNIMKSNSMNPYTVSVVRETPEYKEWLAAKKVAESAVKKLAARIETWILDEDQDPVTKGIKKLIGEMNYYVTNAEVIEKAKLRKILGNPPTSPDKYTIGDELIWETLLEQCDKDLIIVSRDKTFLENYGMLRAEYDSKIRKLVGVTDSLSNALKIIGKPAVAIAKAEKEVKAGANDEITTGICSVCGTEMEESGYEGSEGDSAWWLDCPKCGHTAFPSK
ncbi:PIN domain-containing protein [Massilia sp. Root418]|uniref:PIN domain-containing protein n=1 Tax=Massilia sp. Root418 TaxID=1736532 RepID=UPI000AB82A00|nr:PIN domain-containing protein [Massilia sp. Root418]